MSSAGNTAVANQEPARVDHNPRFELFGSRHGGSYEVFGRDIANLEVTVSSYDEQLATT